MVDIQKTQTYQKTEVSRTEVLVTIEDVIEYLKLKGVEFPDGAVVSFFGVDCVVCETDFSRGYATEFNEGTAKTQVARVEIKKTDIETR